MEGAEIVLAKVINELRDFLMPVFDADANSAMTLCQ